MLTNFVNAYERAITSLEKAKLIELAKKWLNVFEYQQFCKLTGAK